MDRTTGGPAILASKNGIITYILGGMDIEDVAKNHPESIFVEPINVKIGLTPEHEKRTENPLSRNTLAGEVNGQLMNFMNKHVCEICVSS